MFFKKKRSGEAVLPPYEVWKNWSDAEWADFKKGLKGQYVELPREEWEDWTKKEWISQQPPEEQSRIKQLPEAKSDLEFQRWRGRMIDEKLKKEDELRNRGVLPPLKEFYVGGYAPSMNVTHYYNANGQYVGSGVSSGNN